MYDFESVSLSVWLSDALGLFDHTLRAISGLPILYFFLSFLVFRAMVRLFCYMLHHGKRM